jgi:type I restriction enzyme S subunit
VLKFAFEGKFTEDWRMQNKSLSDAKDFISHTNKLRQIDYNKKLENWKKRKADANEEKISKPQKPSNLDVKNDLFEGLVEKEKIPNNWEIVPLVFVSDNMPNSIVDGPFGSSINVAEDYIESGVPVIRMVNIRPFRFVSNQMKFIKESKFQSLRRHNILPSDILIAKVGATIGDCCLYPLGGPEAMLSTTGSCRVRLDKNVMDAKFLEYYVFFHRKTLKEIASQTAQPFLNMKVLKSFPVVLPMIEEQHKIVQAIESRLSVADKMEESITQSLQQAEALRQSILKKAFDGRLV